MHKRTKPSFRGIPCTPHGLEVGRRRCGGGEARGRHPSLQRHERFTFRVPLHAEAELLVHDQSDRTRGERCHEPAGLHPCHRANEHRGFADELLCGRRDIAEMDGYCR